ncbi:MAG TPA: surface carbohydrate biosynthesis protein [Gemmatimonadaceae bacterium]
MNELSHARRILMLVAYKSRDLEGHSLVAYHLQKRYGHEVRLTNIYDVEHKIMKYAPDLLVLDHLMWENKARQARTARELGARVAVLPTEGLFQDKESAVRMAGRVTEHTRWCDRYLAWGDYVRNAVLERGLMTPDQIYTTGCSRFDLYSEPYLALIQSKGELAAKLALENPDAPLILWCTNTTYRTQDRERFFERYVGRAEFTREEVYAMLEDEQTQYTEHSRVVLELARRHPEWNFVIKVHPAEPIADYMPLTRQAPNIRVASDAPIRDFIYHCDVSLQRGCTTATECWMLGKPVVELGVGHFLRAAREEFVSGNHAADSVEEAERAIASYVDGMPVPADQQRARDAFIADFYYRIDGKSSERCAEMLHELVAPSVYSDEDQRQTRAAAAAAYSRWKSAEDARLPNRIKDALGIGRDASLRPWQRWRIGRKFTQGLAVAQPEITQDMVTDVQERYAALLGGRQRDSIATVTDRATERASHTLVE